MSVVFTCDACKVSSQGFIKPPIGWAWVHDEGYEHSFHVCSYVCWLQLRRLCSLDEQSAETVSGRLKSVYFGDAIEPASLHYSTTDRSPTPYIYLIQAGHSGPVKIGVSRTPQKRLRSLQTANAKTLVLRASFFGDAQCEQTIHQYWSRFRLSGEWFSSEVLAMTESVISNERFGFTELLFSLIRDGKTEAIA